MKIRKKDYIISFIVLLLLFSVNLLSGSNIAIGLVKSFFAALIGALIIGTLTNLIFRNKIRTN
jgi:hypothetical protein